MEMENNAEKGKTHLDDDGRVKDEYRRVFERICGNIFLPFFGFLMYVIGIDGVCCQICHTYLHDGDKWWRSDRFGSYVEHGGCPLSPSDLTSHEGTGGHQEALKRMNQRIEEKAKVVIEELQSPKSRLNRSVKSSPTNSPHSFSSFSSSSSSSSSSTSCFYSSARVSACFSRLSAKAAAFLFQLVSWMMCFNIPFQTFHSIIDLLNKSGLTGAISFVNHTSTYAFHCFLRILYVAVRMWVMFGLYGIGKYSIIMDESTTTANVFITLFYIQYRKRNGHVVTQYLGLEVIGKGGASAVELRKHLLHIL
jgi:hypothetical protein